MKIQIEQNVKKTLKVSLIFLSIGLMLGALIVFAATPSSTFYISSGVYPGAPSYTVWKEGSNYFAKDSNGALRFDGTNASAVIQDAIDALGSNGGKIFIKTGVYLISTSINLKANIVLEGEGWGDYPCDTAGTVLKKNANIDMISFNNSAGSLADTSFAIRNLQLFGSTAFTLTGKGISIDHCKDFIIDHVSITRMKGISLHLKDCGIHWIYNSRFMEQEGSAVTDDYIIYEDGSSGDWVIYGNDVGTTSDRMEHVWGIYSEGTGRIIQNKVYLCFGGITSTSGQVSNNEINDCYQYGILLIGSYNICVGNFIYTTGDYTVSGTLTGIVAKARREVIVGNHIKDTWQKIQEGISEWVDGDNNTITSNNIFLNKAGAVAIATSGANTEVKHNIGFITENSGTASVATGATVTHSLAGTPTSVIVIAGETGLTDIYADTLTTTTFKINFAGGGTKTFYWYAEYKP